jgi:hypothetical protein
MSLSIKILNCFLHLDLDPIFGIKIKQHLLLLAIDPIGEQVAHLAIPRYFAIKKLCDKPLLEFKR